MYVPADAEGFLFVKGRCTRIVWLVRRMLAILGTVIASCFFRFRVRPRSQSSHRRIGFTTLLLGLSPGLVPQILCQGVCNTAGRRPNTVFKQGSTK